VVEITHWAMAGARFWINGPGGGVALGVDAAVCAPEWAVWTQRSVNIKRSVFFIA
jgi:hypothetical protein